jgi:hypothetical protein
VEVWYSDLHVNISLLLSLITVTSVPRSCLFTLCSGTFYCLSFGGLCVGMELEPVLWIPNPTSGS